ncbi:Pimeloyl-ACP methyl ester carboxylesterase [Lysobacter sp. yr284]|uniref:alpha/beta fold hydrolase n=1 Tax=Lysobacter TaxID=68 RepID=UPI0008969BA6|nr:alpha/beta hydrolase [Lysobacter sp. yr284]SDY57110.1 Pimeloyl-ACP methyl ester carboxylesterase [Lysobacter sp. yr284]
MNIEQRVVRAWNGRINTRVDVCGSGPPLLFLHGESGHWDPFLDRLAQRFTVYAPDFPGTSPGAEQEIDELRDVWDLTLYFDELLDALGLDSVAVAGHSIGGMFAAELAAHARARIRRLVLIAPAGLWRDDHPVPNWWSIPAAQLPQWTVAQPEGLVGQIMFAVPRDRDAAIERVIRKTWALACAGKFTWPIPDKGLARRIHRISAPSLIVWGRQDRMIPPVYAEEFAARIGGARTLLVDNAGHIPQLEQMDQVGDAVMRFLD